MFLAFCIFFVVVIRETSEGHEEFLSNVSGEIGKGNFTYYTMTYDGTVLLELISTFGDCDLYVSQTTLKPTYEPESYSLQSATCGIDTIIIPKSFNRPIGIGIYGHPSYELSGYHLMFYDIDESYDILNYNPYTESVQLSENKKVNDYIESHKYNDEVETEEYFFWIVLRSLIEFLIEIIL